VNAHLARTIVLYAALVAAWALWHAVRDRGPSRTLTAALLVLELVSVVQAGLDVAGLAGGHRPASTPTNLGDAAASVAILPLILGARGPREGAARADAAIVAVAAAAVAVVAIRLRVTWAAAHA
jgi:hypothetical protein